MRTFKQQLACVVAIGIASSGTALAQGEPTPTEPAPTEPAPTSTAPTESEELCDPPGCPEPAQPQAAQPAPAEPPPPAEPMAMEPEPAPAPAPTPQYEEQPSPWYDRIGIGFSIGGGVDDFTSETMRSTTSIGGGWNARLTVGTKSYVAFEGSYIGSAQGLDALGVDNDAILLGNGAQGALRLNVLTNTYAQPFVYGGVAWRRYDVTNTDFNTSDVADQDDVAEFPAGIGLSGYISGFMADVRAEYRFATAEDLAPSVTDDSGGATLDRWGITGNLGFAY